MAYPWGINLLNVEPSVQNGPVVGSFVNSRPARQRTGVVYRRRPVVRAVRSGLSW